MTTSEDGTSWSAPTITLQSSTPWDRSSVCDPSIVKFRGTYFLYHTCINTCSPSEGHGPPDSYYQNRICVAIADSVSGPWVKVGEPVIEDLSCASSNSTCAKEQGAYCVGQPSAVVIGDEIVVFYSSVGGANDPSTPPNPGRVLAQATSDGVLFAPRETTVQSAMGCKPGDVPPCEGPDSPPPPKDDILFGQRDVDVRYDRDSKQLLLVQGDVGSKTISYSISSDDGRTFLPFSRNRSVQTHNLSDCGATCANHNPGLASLPDGSFGGESFVLTASSFTTPGKWGSWHLWRSNVGVGPHGLGCHACAPSGCDFACSRGANATRTGTCAHPGSSDPGQCCSCGPYVESTPCKRCGRAGGATGCVELCRNAGHSAGGMCAFGDNITKGLCCKCFGVGGLQSHFKSDDRATKGGHLVFANGSEWEIAFSYVRQACSNINPRSHVRGDVPDSMPIAWYNRRLNVSTFISSTSQGVHASTSLGPTLDTLSRADCDRVVFNSSFETTPQSLANHQWLQSVRLLANGSAYGLVHNEFKPELHGGPEFNESICACAREWNHTTAGHTPACQRGGMCEWWSAGLAVSHDGAQTFALAAAPPEHVVFALPRKYEPNQKLQGFGAISTLLPGHDGFYYGLVNINGDSADAGVVAGNCPFRSNDLSDPKSWRGWNGSDYAVKFRDPYAAGTSSDGRCSTIAINESTPFDAHVCFRRLVDGPPSHTSQGFIAVGPHAASGGVRYSVCIQSGGENFEHCMGEGLEKWTAGAQVPGDNVLSLESASRWQTAGSSRVLYPVLFDHRSPDMGAAKAATDKTNPTMLTEDGDNYALTSEFSDTLYLYFVASEHNILRRQVHAGSSAPQAPPPPPPAAIASACETVVVSGAALAAANGEYKKTKTRVYEKDSGHQLYRVNVSASAKTPASFAWHLAHQNVAGSVLYSCSRADAINASGGETPPSWGWGLGASNFSRAFDVAPAPALIACKTDDHRSALS